MIGSLIKATERCILFLSLSLDILEGPLGSELRIEGVIHMSVNIDVKELFEAGVHFGHKTSRWHPKMAPYIHSKRDGSHIIDLTQTAVMLEGALDFLTKITGEGKQVLIVGTKRQAQKAVKEAAAETGMPYVTERWLGGMLTNRNTIGGRVKHLKRLEEDMANGKLASRYSKLEVQRYQEEIEQMNINYGGIKNMVARPGAVFVTDVLHDVNAVREAKKLNISVVAIVDTNADPSQIDYPIPANDDAIKSIQKITDYVVSAISGGAQKAAKSAAKETADKDEKISEVK